MSETAITGFLVVRLPQFNFLTEGDKVPVIDNLFYSGMKREPWVDVFDEDYFAKKTPENILRIATKLKTPPDFTGIDVCWSENEARQLLEYSNRHGERNELIVIRSSPLEKIKGAKAVINGPIEWLGFDCVALGEWSLIEAGIFREPDYYQAWRSKINKFGLFDDAALVPAYAKAYEEAVTRGKSEPLAKESDIFFKISVEVGRLAAPQ